ncbi:MAG: cobalamin biosynthesis protein CobW [Oscillospiraceae bacterium]|nr:cobalamin biosynthesis protein CobW [Oscillospiraceae bacterium]
MTKIDIYSGFLGAGKTTLIKKLISEGYKGQKLVLIENEFGEIGIDGGFLQDAGINITEMNSGCICCSLVGDFGKALEKVISEYHPDRVIIEPSGVGKLSDVIGAVKKVVGHDVELGYAVAVADANKVKVYMKNFGEFYNNQIETASTIVLSRTTGISDKKLDTALELIREHNAAATIVTTPWEDLSGEQLIAAFEGEHTLKKHMEATEQEHHHHHHDHDDHCCCGHDHEHHHEHGEECGCGHHHHDEGCHEHHHGHEPAECGYAHHRHDHDEHCCCGHDHDHEHHHHLEHGEECACGHHHDHEHHHHHDHGENCTCGCHDHDHHHHHHADEVFTSWGRETAKKYTAEQISSILEELDSGEYGIVLRAKGIVAGMDGKWIHFDHVPGEADVRFGSADVMGRLCVIGSKLSEEAVAKLFGV